MDVKVWSNDSRDYATYERLAEERRKRGNDCDCFCSAFGILVDVENQSVGQSCLGLRFVCRM